MDELCEDLANLAYPTFLKLVFKKFQLINSWHMQPHSEAIINSRLEKYNTHPLCSNFLAR